MWNIVHTETIDVDFYRLTIYVFSNNKGEYFIDYVKDYDPMDNLHTESN